MCDLFIDTLLYNHGEGIARTIITLLSPPVTTVTMADLCPNCA